MREKLLHVLRDYSLLLVGSFLYALAFDWLFVPNNIAMGGFTGLSQTVNLLVPAIPIGAMVAALNIPLFLLGIYYQGIGLLISSVFAMAASSVFIDILPDFITFTRLDDKLAACIFGGVLAGAALGMMLWVGATTGGTELAASLLKRKFHHISIGKICLVIDFVIIAFYALVMRAFNEAIYAIIALFIMSYAMDFVIYGRKNSKVACIITDKGEDLMQELLLLDLGVTELTGRGGFSQHEKKVLICAFKPGKIAMIKSSVIKYDPDAFVIVCDVQDVFGEGFDQCKLNSL